MSLTLNEGECVLIGADIRVMFVRPLTRGRIVIGVDAPRDVEVDREAVRASKLADRRVAQKTLMMPDAGL